MAKPQKENQGYATANVMIGSKVFQKGDPIQGCDADAVKSAVANGLIDTKSPADKTPTDEQAGN